MFFRNPIIDVVALELLLSIKVKNKEIAQAIGINATSASLMKRKDPCRYALIRDGLRVKKLQDRVNNSISIINDKKISHE